MDSLIISKKLGNINSPDELFIKRLYNYHYKGGFKSIMTENIVSLLINYFLLFFINFLTNCIDYHGLVFNEQQNIDFFNYINMSNWFPQNAYLIICFVLYTIYILCCTINTIFTIQISWKIRKIYYKKLNIKDTELKLIDWNTVVDRIKIIYPDPNLNIYTIASKIMRKDNLTICLFRHNDLIKYRMSKFLEWNFIYCFVNSLFDKNDNITQELLDNYQKNVKKRLKLVIIINLLALPFILYIIMVYSIIKYGEKFYHHPELITNRQMSIKSKWRIRYYNELPHNLGTRLCKIDVIVKKLISNNNYTPINVIIRFSNFILGSIFILLLSLSVINDNLLTECYIGNKNMLWLLGIMGAVILLSRKLSISNSNSILSEEKEKNLFANLQKLLASINPEWFSVGMRKKCMLMLNSIYKYKILFILLEIWYIVVSPYYIYQWSKQIKKINIKEIIEQHYILGNVVSKSLFTNINLVTKDPHCYASLQEFKKNNPEWVDIMSYHLRTGTSFIDEPFVWENASQLEGGFRDCLNTTIIFGNKEINEENII
jgi:hypothetical protein